MVTDNLRNNVVDGLRNGLTPEDVKATLVEQGWSAEDVDTVLEEQSRGDQISNETDENQVVTRDKRKLLLAAGALLLVGLIIFGFILLFSDSESQPPAQTETEGEETPVTFPTGDTANGSGLQIIDSRVPRTDDRESTEEPSGEIDEEVYIAPEPSFKPQPLIQPKPPGADTPSGPVTVAPSYLDRMVSDPTYDDILNSPYDENSFIVPVDIPGVDFSNFDPAAFLEMSDDERFEAMLAPPTGYEEYELEFAEALRDCEEFTQTLQHDIFGVGLEVDRQILGWVDGKCTFIEVQPNNAVITCELSKSQAEDIADAKIAIVTGEDLGDEDPFSAAFASGDCRARSGG